MSHIGDFFRTAKTGRASQILQLIEEGFDVDTANEQGDTALMLASYYGNPDTVKILLEYGAKVNARNTTGQTALMYACNKKNVGIVKLLLSKGGDPYIQDTAGRNAIGWIPEGDDGKIRALLTERVILDDDSDEKPESLPTDTGSVPHEQYMSARKKVEFPTKPQPKVIEIDDPEPVVTEQTAPQPQPTPQPQPKVEKYQSLEMKTTIDEPETKPTEVKPSKAQEKLAALAQKENTNSYQAISQDEIQLAILENEKKKKQKINISKTTSKPFTRSVTKTPKITEYPSNVSHIKPPDRVIFHAFRMNWLRWLAQPLVLLWKGLVWLSKYLWTLVVRSWRGMKLSFHYRNWLIALPGISIAVFIAVIGFFLSKLFEFAPIFWIGLVIGIIPINWALAEITANIKIDFRLHTGPTIREKRSYYRNGTRNMVGFLQFLIFLIFCLFILVGIHYAKRIPEVGDLVHSTFYLPALFIGGLAFLILLIMIFSMQVLPSYLLHHPPAEEKTGLSQFVSVTGSLIHHIAKKFPRLILINIPAVVMAVLTLIPVVFIVGGGLGLFGLTGWAVENFSLDALIASYNTDFLVYLDDWKDYVNFFLSGIALSVSAGVIFSFPFSHFAATNYLLYIEKSPIEWKK